jgi:hypothetical protein
MKEASPVWHEAAMRFKSELQSRENVGGSNVRLKVGDEGDSAVYFVAGIRQGISATTPYKTAETAPTREMLRWGHSGSDRLQKRWMVGDEQALAYQAA